MEKLTLAAASKAIHNGETTSLALTNACLETIEAQNPNINAIITPMREDALARAAMLDAEAKTGKFRSPLHGIAIALKDNIDCAGVPTTNASAARKNSIPAEDSWVVQSLKKAGAIIIAKANLAEFSVSPTGATSHFGPVRNPRSPDRVPGGSSSGSAAAVATGMCFGALGTDSGGSVRIPASWCGLVGLKPTSGLVSMRGIGPGLPMLDNCGPIARTVEDVALLLQSMTGYDPLYPISVDRPHENYAAGLDRSVAGLRVGVPRHPFFEELDTQIADAVNRALAILSELTAEVKDVALEGIEPNDPLINMADIYSAHKDFLAKHGQDYQPLTRRLLQSCKDVVDDPATGSASDKVSRYIRSTAELFHRQRTADAVLAGFDVVALPTTKSFPPTIEAALGIEYGSGENYPYINIDNTYRFNVLGLPALTLPCGVSGEGLPIGLMLCGPRFNEATLLALGAAYERAASRA